MCLVKKLFAAIIVVFTTHASFAEVIDLSGVTLSGSNPYTFNDPALGTVMLTYSGNFHTGVEGIITNFGSVNSIGIGQSTGAGLGVLDVTWTNPISTLDFRMYDLDLGESIDFELPNGVDVSLISGNPLISNTLSGTVLTAGGADIFNANVNNYSLLQLSGSPFTTFQASFQRPGSSSGAGGIGFGDGTTVPEPSGVLLLASLLAFRLRGQRA